MDYIKLKNYILWLVKEEQQFVVISELKSLVFI